MQLLATFTHHKVILNISGYKIHRDIKELLDIFQCTGMENLSGKIPSQKTKCTF